MAHTSNRVEDQCKAAYLASPKLMPASTELKNKALSKMAEIILTEKTAITIENKKDIENGQKNGLTKALIDRLTLTEDRLQGISDSLKSLIALDDPIGDVVEEITRPNGLKIKKVRVPMGVIGMIYEARPNVTADAIGLAIKTGNAVVLRGSSSAYHSNRIIADLLTSCLESTGLPGDAIQLLEDVSRDSVDTFVKMKEYLSLIIPRGGAGLIQRVCETATVPTIETGVGNCHVYIDQDADIKKGLDIMINAKTHRPSVCNAAETMLVHQNIAKEFLPEAISKLKELGVEIRGCAKTKAIVSDISDATDDDWDTEYLDLILAVKVVSSVDEAISHIQKHGTLHSEAIVTENRDAADKFTSEIDAAAVLVNASTRFVGGGEFGFGAEIGISTQKLHARGPMGTRELTTTKFVVIGDGQVRT